MDKKQRAIQLAAFLFSGKNNWKNFLFSTNSANQARS